MGTLSAIYRKLDLAHFDDAAPRFQTYLDSQRDYQKNRLPLSAEERDEVGRRWGEAFEKLGYPV